MTNHRKFLDRQIEHGFPALAPKPWAFNLATPLEATQFSLSHATLPILSDSAQTLRLFVLTVRLSAQIVQGQL